MDAHESFTDAFERDVLPILGDTASALLTFETLSGHTPERVEAGQRALRNLRTAAADLGGLAQRLTAEVRQARSAMLAAAGRSCEVLGRVCPEHGTTVTAALENRLPACRVLGCRHQDEIAITDWNDCVFPAVAVITDAEGVDELRVCSGHLVDARARLEGLRIVRLADGGGERS